MEQYSRFLIEQALEAAKGAPNNAAEMLKLKNPPPGDDQLSYHNLMEQQSRLLIVQALRNANGSLRKAAQLLKLPTTYLARLSEQKNITIARE